MKDSIISVKNIGKKYNINHQKGGYIALRDVIASIFKNPFSFLKSKTKEVFGIDVKEEFWALKNINFEVDRGDVVGIIGKNGAGKSTLLKILSQITPPTTGEIRINGTVGSLLEVGTGFHPELTGRENIFMNGSILGITKKDIIKKFDDIVAFAGIEKFIDTPVKYYSSGMYVRLAFSVAAHMDTDILIVDEVLAVGDSEFQKKCLGKMEEITKDGGRTIIFVSHNISAVKELCKKAILLDAGVIKVIDTTDKVLGIYNKNNSELTDIDTPIELKNTNKNKELAFNKIWITKNGGSIANTIPHNEEFQVNLEIEVTKEIGPMEISITFKNSSGVNVTSTSLSDSMGGQMYNFKNGRYILKIKIRSDFLIPDTYALRIYAHEKGIKDIDLHEDAIKLKIVDTGSTMRSYGEASTYWACVFSNADWELKKQD